MKTGIDIISIERVKRAVERTPGFLGKVFTSGEIDYCYSKKSPFKHLAGRFAVKEAVSKALRTGIGGKISFLDIEVVNASGSAVPVVRFIGEANHLISSKSDIKASIAYTNGFAIAVAIL